MAEKALTEEQFAPLEQNHKARYDKLLKAGQSQSTIDAHIRKWNMDRVNVGLSPHTFDGNGWGDADRMDVLRRIREAGGDV